MTVPLPHRRALLGGLIAAPAVVLAGRLMPARSWRDPRWEAVPSWRLVWTRPKHRVLNLFLCDRHLRQLAVPA